MGLITQRQMHAYSQKKCKNNKQVDKLMTNYYSEQEGNDSPFYEQPKKNAVETKGKIVFNEKNYLNTRLENGEVSRKIKIRILPVKPGSSKIALPVSIHSLKVDKEMAKSGFKTFLCLDDENLPNHDSRGCPICRKSRDLFNQANEIPKNDEHAEEKKKALFKEAYRFQPKTAYIVRVIERGKEDEGVKFWRFNHWDNGNGCKDQLENLYNQRKEEMEEAGVPNFNIFDLYNGKDIVLTLSKSQNQNSHVDKTEIKITDAGMCTPLSKDDWQIEEWVNDSKDWKDMYACKDYKYLEIVADGGIPVYSREAGGFVEKKDKEQQDDKAEQEIVDEIRKGAPDNSGSDEDENDLPF